MSKGLLDSKVDFVLKNIFGADKNPQILISFFLCYTKTNKGYSLLGIATEMFIDGESIDKIKKYSKVNEEEIVKLKKELFAN